MSDFLEKLRRVNLRQALEVWKLPVAAVGSLAHRRKHPDLWIVCEDAKEARDNGYWFFKYVREHHPEQDIVYAIDPSSVDFEKVASLGPTVPFGTLKHWIAYLASSKKISSQKAGNPNAAIFYALEVYGLLKDVRIFLQHGITKDNAQWLYYEKTRIAKFICGAQPEYEYIRETFGYPEGAVEYVGFCRFDNLHDAQPDPRLVLIMPSWREWIADEDHRLLEYEGTTNIPETNYFKKWCAFLTSPELRRIAREHDVRFVFYPHRNMQKYLQYFPESTPEVEVVGAADWDIQDLLKRASLMVTDYSSVFFDFVYMKKPVIFYQFDYDQFRKGQYGEGYFDYRDNSFGKSYADAEDVLVAIERSIECGYAISDAYEAEHRRYFPLYDEGNCARVYDVVKGA